MPSFQRAFFVGIGQFIFYGMDGLFIRDVNGEDQVFVLMFVSDETGF